MKLSDKMNIQEANIKVFRVNEKVDSIAVLMPIWSKQSEHGNLLVKIPMLGLETIAKDDLDADKAIEEALVSFCIAAEKFGQGIEKELQALGWIAVDDESGEPVLGYNISDTDSVIERIMETADNYVNPHLSVTPEPAIA